MASNEVTDHPIEAPFLIGGNGAKDRSAHVPNGVPGLDSYQKLYFDYMGYR